MALMETLKRINKDGLQDFKLRVGIAVGPVIAGIVGASKPQYDIWVMQYRKITSRQLTILCSL